MRPNRSSTFTALTVSILLAGAALPGSAHAQLQPGENVRLTFQFIQADGFTETDPRISDVVDQLRQLFRFEGYRLYTEATVLAALPEGDMPNVVRQAISPSNADRFRLETFVQMEGERARLYISLGKVEGYGEGEIMETVIEVGVNVRDGQTVVLGSSKYSADHPTLILAVRVSSVRQE